jgi:LmbE family N-acetylglucosaminyl deacetylase
MPVIDVEAGTPEAAWRACPQLLDLREYPSASIRRVAVVSPHPDDETLGLGGFLNLLSARNVEIVLIALTEGEAFEPHASKATRAELAQMRSNERREALRALGLSHARVVTLELPDGELSSTPHLAELLLPWVREVDRCFAPFQSDGHPDHDAAGRAAAGACEVAGVALAEYPIWAWNWARPDSEDIPWSRATRVALSRKAREAKARGVSAYRSQIEPRHAGAGAVLPPQVLAHFERDFEVLFV